MAGKRLLDAAKLFNAGTSIAKQHFVLRRQQWDVYTNTSSLAKAVKSQTDRVTVTAAAAVELAKRFSETSPVWQQQQQQRQWQEEQRTSGFAEPTDDASRNADAAAARRAQEAKERTETVRPTANETRSQALGVEYEQDEGALSSLRKRELQRQAERQIPAVTADAQSPAGQVGGEDTFSERTQSSSPELSSLPRSKLPKHSEAAPASSEPVQNQGLNQDVYPTPQQAQPNEAMAEEVPEDITDSLFTSPRVSRMLGKTGAESQNPYAGRQKLPPKPLPEMVAAREQWQQETPEPEVMRKEPASAAAASATVGEGDAETQRLAASLSREAEVCATTSRAVSSTAC